MVILGIDPGYATVGYGVVRYDGHRFEALGFGAITTPPDMEFGRRLEIIYRDMGELIEQYRPDYMSIEKLFFNTNITTGIEVAHARGIILLQAVQHGLPYKEYTPLQVKQAITGYGKAEKRQVIEMVKSFLSLSKAPKPDDTADALALAICHGHSVGNLFGKISKEVAKK